ncbi:isochorismatase [Paenibacillus sp. SYP-B3998]|uniref:isochorismatase n=1 Tax=Paenibacillus sp. SYP-B3998 TaxID=2678564 RepID=A0A6G3ZW83_9BACL|nr:isochorismatase [Paenibacillus sp. SYP-B3998]NEW06375.1 isochorismatase [Paenibacillus sp. SYP-B3998]
MALPAIVSYPMPGASDLPENKVSWTPDPKRAVLLIHDMQRYFVDAFTAGESPIVELLANIKLLKNQCAQLGIPVVYSAQPGGQTPEQRGLLQDFWGSGINDGPYQKQIVEELAPDEHDIQLTKWRYSAFRKTNLLEIMQERGRDQLIVCGIYAHIGCLLTTCEAFMQDIEPFFVIDAVADFSWENHKMAMTYAAQRCAVTTTTRSLLDELNKKQSGQEEAAAATDLGLLTLELVREHIAQILYESPSDIADSDDLINDRGLDSVRIMSLVEKWRRSGIEVTFVELAERPTLIEWWELLSSRQQQAIPNIDYYAL